MYTYSYYAKNKIYGYEVKKNYLQKCENGCILRVYMYVYELQYLKRKRCLSNIVGKKIL